MKLGSGKTQSNRPRKSKAGIAVQAEDNPKFFENLFEGIKDITPDAVIPGGLLAYAQANPQWYFESFLVKLLPSIIAKGALGARNAANQGVSVNIVNYSGSSNKDANINKSVVDMKQNSDGTLEVIVSPERPAPSE